MKIVVLDDSKTVLLMISALLEELGVEDDSILLFSDGHEALNYIEKHGADIIFSDINMPGMDGFEFVSRLLELSKRAVSSLFIVSADEHYGDINHMKNIGAKRFIRKPINTKHFNHFVAPEIAKYKERNKGGIKEAKNNASDTVSQLDLSGIDYEELAAKMGIKPKHIHRLMESFISESTTSLRTLKEAIARNDYKQIEQCAHFLKGSAGNMQFNDLYEMARLIELSAIANEDDFAYEEYYIAIKKGLETISQKVKDV